MRKTVNLLLALFFASTLSMWAVPAKRGFLTHTQSDGTTIRVQTLGDEHFHSLATEDGLIIKRNSDGDFCYASAKGITTTLAHNKTDRTINEVSFIEGMGNALNFSEASSSTSISRRIIARVEEAQRASQVPYIGKVKVPIIVVDYADKKVSNSLQAFKTHFSDDTNSARQYFVDQSNGKFEPQFDVYGVYTLSENRAAYGANLSNGDDQGVGKMVAEACDLAQANSSINWADYDNDGDRMCDVVIVVYAGVGEAQASTTVPESVWPCQWTLAGAANSGDGPGAKTYDGIIVNKFAVFNEVNGYKDTGTQMDGIGTFCHEFSHCLGLPDFYMTTYGSNYGMGSWSLMDYGCYNNNGTTPVGYSAYEKSFFGWIQLETPVENTEYTLPVFNSKSAASDRALKLVNKDNANEYFVVENRRRQGWDSYIKDEGVLITHVTYIPVRWQVNSVNNFAVQLMTIMPADNVATDATEATDLFGETNHEFTDMSAPAAVLNLGSTTENYPVGNQGFLGKPITDIYLNPDLTATLRYCDSSGAKLTADVEELNFGEVYYSEPLTKQIYIKGENITGPTSLSIVGDSQHFVLGKSVLTAEEVNEGVVVDVVFTPHQFGNLGATLVLTNDQRPPLNVDIVGRGVVKAFAPELQEVDPATVTSEGFKAEWTDNTAALGVKDYSLKLSCDNEPDLVFAADFSSLASQTNSKGELVDCLSKYAQFLPKGWKATKALYIWDGHIVPYGKINATPISTMSEEKISVVVRAKSLNEEAYSKSAITVQTSKESKKVVMEGDEQDYVYVLNCNPNEESLVFSTNNLPAISSIKVYAGNITYSMNSGNVVLGEGSNDSHQLITGITAKSYEVTGLKPCTEYKFKLQANYMDGTSSEWSQSKKVTTKNVEVSAASLGNFLQNAEVGTPVAVSDGTLTCIGVLGDGRTLITKDENGYPDKDFMAANEVDYVMSRTSFMRGHDTWDQSNWILVELPEPMSTSQQADIVGHSLNGVGGTLSDVDNPAIATTAVPTGGDEVVYDGNTYISANFLGTQTGANTNSDGTFTTYFFVKPKPNEIARVQWAMWVESEQCFKAPTSVGPSNQEGLDGTFYVDMSKFAGAAPQFIDGGIYSFEGLITIENVDGSHSTRRRAPSVAPETRYVVYPLRDLSLDGEIHGDIITGLNNIQASKQVVGVEYINLSGVHSSEPFSGANVVVKTYSDGSRSVSKMVK